MKFVYQISGWFYLSMRKGNAPVSLVRALYNLQVH